MIFRPFWRLAPLTFLVMVCACGEPGSGLPGRPVEGLSGCVVEMPGYYYVGVLLPWEGRWPIGMPLSHSAIQAVLEINEQGGIRGETLGLVACNTRGDASIARRNALELARTSLVSGVVGGVTSDEAVALAAVAQEQQLPAVSPSVNVGQLSGLGGGWMGDTASSIDRQAYITSQIVRRDGFRNAMLIYPADLQGEAFESAFRADFVGDGRSSSSIAYDQRDPDFALNTALAALVYAASVVYIDAPPSEAAAIMLAASNRAYRPRWLLGPRLRSVALIQELGTRSPLEGTTGLAGTYSGRPEVSRFRDQYRERWGRDAEPYSVNTYDATYAMAIAMALSEDPADRDAVRVNLANEASGTPVAAGDWQGILGALVQGSVAYQGVGGPMSVDNGTLGVVGDFEEWVIGGDEIVTTGCFTSEGLNCP